MASLISPSVLSTLPLISLEPRSIASYLRTGQDYLAYCVAAGVPSLPATYFKVMGFILSLFYQSVNPRSFASITSRLKWFVTNVLHARWLTADKDSYRAFLAGRRALSKFNDTPTRKTRPLYEFQLRQIASILSPSSFDIICFAFWALARVCMQRAGELLDSKARRANIHLFHSGSRQFYVYAYFSWSKPKQHKTKQAPYALFSRRHNRLAFDAISTLLDILPDTSPSALLFPSVCPRSSRIRSQTPLSSSAAVKWLRLKLTRVGTPNPSAYALHSARRGGFSDAMAAGIPLRYAEVQGHWAPGSMTAVAEYDDQAHFARLRYF